MYIYAYVYLICKGISILQFLHIAMQLATLYTLLIDFIF